MPINNWDQSLTQRSSGFLPELSISASLIDGGQECGHVLSKTPQAIGATALHVLQVPSVGVNGPLKHILLSPGDKRRPLC